MSLVKNKIAITKEGLSMLSQLQEGHEKIKFTKLGLGSGSKETLDIENMENPFIFLPLDNIESTGKEVQISFYFTNKGYREPLTISEKGLFATIDGEKEILFAYGVMEEEIIPTPEDLVISRHENIVLAFGEGEIDLTVEISTGVTNKEFLNHAHDGQKTKQISYEHLLHTPTSMPANGGNADTVNHIAFREGAFSLEYKKAEATGWKSISSPIVKSIQRGIADCRNGTKITHNPVNIDSSIILLNGAGTIASTSYLPFVLSRESDFFIIGSGTASSTTKVSYQLVEFH